MEKCSHEPENDKLEHCTIKEQMMEERRCENCWYCHKDMSLECRINPPTETDNTIYVAADQWCGKFYSKEMPPPWEPMLVHSQS